MKLIALFATAAFAAQDEQVLDEYVDMMMRQASGDGSAEETDLDEAIEAKHGHGPHGHGPHGHNPHRHCPHDHYYWSGGCSANCGGGNQQRWRQYDSNPTTDGCQWSSYHESNHGCNTHACPTPYPTPFPTPFPTPHPCDDGSHNCDTAAVATSGGFGIAAGTKYTSIALADGCTVNDADDQIEYITLDSTSGNTVSATVGYKPLHSGGWTMSSGVSVQCWHYANGWDSAPVLDRQDAGIGYSYGSGNGPSRTHEFTFTVERASVAQHYLRCGIIDRSSSTCKFDDNNHCATSSAGSSSGHHYDNSDAPFTSGGSSSAPSAKGVCYKEGGNRWRCGCAGGHWCTAGCSAPHVGHTCSAITASPTPYPTPAPTSYPTPQPTMYPTPYPTPYPTANPTAAPTATCPVTCEIDNGQFVNKQVYGYKNFGTKSKYGTKLYKRLVTTHNLEVINEQDSYAKHRCYKYGADQCTCECIDDEAFFMDTTHRGKNADQSIQTIATLKATGKFWKAPNYWISHTEIKAVKKCCAEEVAINPEFIIPAHSCADVLAATDEVIKTRIEELEPTTSNTKIINWLKAQGCYN